MSVHALRDDWLMSMGPSLAVAPSAWPQALADIAAAIASAKGIAAPAGGQESDAAKAIAAALQSGERKAVLLGNAAARHPEAATIERLGRWIAEQTGASFGWLVDGANAVGAQLVGAAPQGSGASAAQMLGASAPLKACVLLNVEPMFDAGNGPAAVAALSQAEMVVSMTSFKPHPGDDLADVLLPIAPFTETSGTFVNAEGRVQGFHGVVKPQGDARPAWKVLRVLGNLLGLTGFAFETSEQVRDEALGDVATIAARLTAVPASANESTSSALPAAVAAGTLERIADVPIYAADAIVRRASSLQLTADARPPVVGVPSELAAEHGIVDGSLVRVTQASASVVLPAHVDASLASNVVRVAAGHPLTAPLGAMFGAVELSVVAAPAEASSRSSAAVPPHAAAH
jgi:NADH-quinone oxidoreductase subunit G